MYTGAKDKLSLVSVMSAIVADTDKRFLDRLHDVYSAMPPQKAMDILVYTPQEIDRMKVTNPFIRKALNEGKVRTSTRRGDTSAGRFRMDSPIRDRAPI